MDPFPLHHLTRQVACRQDFVCLFFLFPPPVNLLFLLREGVLSNILDLIVCFSRLVWCQGCRCPFVPAFWRCFDLSRGAHPHLWGHRRGRRPLAGRDSGSARGLWSENRRPGNWENRVPRVRARKYWGPVAVKKGEPISSRAGSMCPRIRVEDSWLRPILPQELVCSLGFLSLVSLHSARSNLFQANICQDVLARDVCGVCVKEFNHVSSTDNQPRVGVV